MKASDIDKVQSLLRERDKYRAWLRVTGKLLAPKEWQTDNFVVGAEDEEIVLKAGSDVGREVLALIKRHTEEQIAAIEAQLRAMGVEP